MNMILNCNDFANKFEYINYLESNGLIPNGCALCMSEYGVCEEAVAKFASPDELYVECIPFGDIPSGYFPTSCLREWRGEECVENII